MNLAVEYYTRHKTSVILPTNDGMCFFNNHKKPAVIALTSVTPKAYTSCKRCAETNSWIAIDLFIPNRDMGFEFTSHQHVSPDTNLVNFIKESTLPESKSLEPAMFPSGQEIELWLWKFFFDHNSLKRSPSYSQWAKQQQTVDEPLRTCEQMARVATFHTKCFHAYFAMYQILITGRKYIYCG